MDTIERWCPVKRKVNEENQNELDRRIQQQIFP